MVLRWCINGCVKSVIALGFGKATRLRCHVCLMEWNSIKVYEESYNKTEDLASDLLQ